MSVTKVVHFSFPFLVHYCIPIDNMGLMQNLIKLRGFPLLEDQAGGFNS